MSDTAKKSDPKLWDKVKEEITEGDKGGRPGQWSARKAQMAVQQYKKEGGGYEGQRDPYNHLHQWSEEDWGTRSGEKSGDTGERYLPKAARNHLSDADYDRTSAKKRADTRKGRQVSAQPEDIAEKTARDRDNAHAANGRSKADLYAEARRRDLPGRSRMSKAELEKALS